mmetsp:Transcript_29474/g.51227  ORF Transcript_29474/g.51227 Transcript_29474/m.51227 type:complete len:286 (+) Transcript_29474:264-1121(+)
MIEEKEPGTASLSFIIIIGRHVYKLSHLAFSQDVYYADGAVPAGHGQLARGGREVQAEHAPAQPRDRAHQPVLGRAVEHLCFVRSTSTSCHKSAVRAKLGRVEHARLVADVVRAVPGDLLDRLARAVVPGLQCVVRPPAARQHRGAVDVERVPREVRPIEAARHLTRPQVPEQHVVVPAASDRRVRVPVLAGEHPVRVAHVRGRAVAHPAFHLQHGLLGLLVVDAHYRVLPDRGKLETVRPVRKGIKLLVFYRDCRKALPRSHVPVLDVSSSIGGNEHILCLGFI